MSWPHCFLAEEETHVGFLSAGLGLRAEFSSGCGRLLSATSCVHVHLKGGQRPIARSKGSWTLDLGFLTPVLTPELPEQGPKVKRPFQFGRDV